MGVPRLTLKSFEKADGLVSAISVSDKDFQARLAFGIRNKPSNGRTTWLVIEVADGSATGIGMKELANDDLPEEELEVVLGIAATEETWGSSVDDVGFLESVGDRKFFVTGEAPFFIRHLWSANEVWATFRDGP